MTRPAKADVLAALDREQARLIVLLEELGPERAGDVVVGEWSARDVVAHCVYWTGMLARMMGARLMPPSWVPRWQSEHEVGTDELNRLTVDHYRRGPLETLLADFRFTARAVRDIVAGMKEENLVLPAGVPWESGTTVAQAISGESHGHWKEHADELATVLRKAPAADAGGEVARGDK